jgi:pimeloyl-ACP methyl ester carboxylesterase
VYVEFGGEGQGILLLHGLMGRARLWWAVAQWLTEFGRVVATDARGHGRNPKPGGPWRTEDFVADAAEAIDKLGLAPAVVIGHSMGGLHACALAATHPELVRAVVVEEFAPDHRGGRVDHWRAWFDLWPVPFQSLAHVRAFFGGQSPTLGNHFTELVEEHEDGYRLISDLDELYEIAAEWGEREYWSFIDRVRCPLLAVEAEPNALPKGQMRQLAERVPGGGRYLAVPGAGHVVHEDEPELYRRAVTAFLSEALVSGPTLEPYASPHRAAGKCASPTGS